VSLNGRMEMALNEMLEAKWEIQRADAEPDPVEQRRGAVRAAKHLRRAADELDDQERLSG
jgi:phosphate uptake regulator